MLSRRLESGLSTDELRTILCRVTMRNTRFTWGRDKGRGWARVPLPPSVSSWPSLSHDPPSSGSPLLLYLPPGACLLV